MSIQTRSNAPYMFTKFGWKTNVLSQKSGKSDCQTRVRQTIVTYTLQRNLRNNMPRTWVLGYSPQPACSGWPAGFISTCYNCLVFHHQRSHHKTGHNQSTISRMICMWYCCIEEWNDGNIGLSLRPKLSLPGWITRYLTVSICIKVFCLFVCDPQPHFSPWKWHWQGEAELKPVTQWQCQWR